MCGVRWGEGPVSVLHVDVAINGLEETVLFPFWLLCHTLVDHICVGLFLGLLFCSIDLCVSVGSFFFLLYHVAVGSQVACLEIEPGLQQWKPSILATRPPGNSFMCPFLCQHHTVWIPVALEDSLKTGNVMTLALFFFLKIVLAVWESFVVLYKF